MTEDVTRPDPRFTELQTRFPECRKASPRCLVARSIDRTGAKKYQIEHPDSFSTDDGRCWKSFGGARVSQV